MTIRPTVITTTTNVRDAAKMMASGHFRRLPVVGDAGLAGIIDITDVCRALLEPGVSGTPETVAGRTARGPCARRRAADIRDRAA